MNKPFLRARRTGADALYIPMAWEEIALSRDFWHFGRPCHHPDHTQTCRYDTVFDDASGSPRLRPGRAWKKWRSVRSIAGSATACRLSFPGLLELCRAGSPGQPSLHRTT
jgi:hypothetical protein